MRWFAAFLFVLAETGIAHDCLSLMLGMARNPREDSWSYVVADAIHEGKFDFVSDKGLVDQSHLHELFITLFELDRAELRPGGNHHEIMRLRMRRNQLLGEPTVWDSTVRHRIEEKFSVILPHFPERGLNPYPSWSDAQDDGLFVKLPSGRYHDPEDPMEAHYGPFLIKAGVWILNTPVTQLQWALRMGHNPSHYQLNAALKIGDHNISPARPVENVNIRQINEFLLRLNEDERMDWGDRKRRWETAFRDLGPKRFPDKYYQYRLPSRSELQWATGAGNNPQYCFPLPDDASLLQIEDQLSQYAWFRPDIPDPYTILDATRMVGRLLPNAWGIYDGHGNVDEWTATPTYSSTEYAVVVGGFFGSSARSCETRTSHAGVIHQGLPSRGFRIVREEFSIDDSPTFSRP